MSSTWIVTCTFVAAVDGKRRIGDALARRADVNVTLIDDVGSSQPHV
jgi:hypothetical protein